MESTRQIRRMGVKMVACGWALLFFYTSVLMAQTGPTVRRVSFSERADGRGHVVRVHLTQAMADDAYEVDLIGREEVLVVLRGAFLSENVRKDAPKGPVVRYEARQGRQHVEIRLHLAESAPVNIVYYPDLASSDFLVALNRGGSHPTLTAPPAIAARTNSDTETSSEASRQQESLIESEAGSRDPGPVGGKPDSEAASPNSEPVSGDERADAVETRAGGSVPVRTAALERRPAHQSTEGRQEMPRAVRIDAPAIHDRPEAGRPMENVPWTLDCIVIDAGHGGKDPGTMAHGLREKDVALAIALKLGRAIEERLGVRVVYTRTDDRFIELDQRGKIANEAGGKLFVSIHVDGIGGSRARTVRGTSTYFLGLHKTEAAAGVMERENAVVKLESDPGKYASYNDDNLIVMTLAQSAFLEKSEQLAGRIQEQFEQYAKRHSRGVKQAGFYVLWSASMPAVLVETGFATQPDEARYLNSEEGQERIAESIFRAVRDYKIDYERDLGVSARYAE